MQRSLAKTLWYRFLYHFFRMFFVTTCRLRVRGRDFEPREGGVLVVSNHQSYLDPILVGLSCERRLNFLARSTLFRFAPLRWHLNSLDTIPIQREGIGMGGLKETLRRLKRQEMVLVFPEGTRSVDGEVAPLKPGFCVMARRGKATLLPVAVAGPFEVWPRRSRLPRLGVINVQIGHPLLPEHFQQMNDNQLVAEVQARIIACHALAQNHVQRARGG